MCEVGGFLARAVTPALVVCATLTGASTRLDAVALLAAADAARAPYHSGRVTIRVTDDRAGRHATDGEIEVLFGGEDVMLAIFRSGKQAGRRLLTKGDRTWLLVPGARNPIPMNRQQRLAGAASIADLARLDLAGDYKPTIRDELETIDGQSCQVLDLAAASSATGYPTAVLWIDAEQNLPRRLLLRLASRKEAKRLDFIAYRVHGGAPSLARLEIRDLIAKRAGVTTLEFLGHDPAPIDPSWFTIEGARGVR